VRSAGGRAPADLVAELRRAVRPLAERGARPVIVVDGPDRARVHATLSRHLPDAIFLSPEDVAAEERVDVFASVAGGSLRAA
jgi:flagellar biosynthesis component FlhA